MGVVISIVEVPITLWHCQGATTVEEYRKYVEKDKAATGCTSPWFHYVLLADVYGISYP